MKVEFSKYLNLILMAIEKNACLEPKNIQRALKQSCHSLSFYPSVFSSVFFLCPSFGSSICQPARFSLYLTLRGNAADIKYLKADGLVKPLGNLSTEKKEKETGRELSLSSVDWSLQEKPKGGRAPSGPRAPPRTWRGSSQSERCDLNAKELQRMTWPPQRRLHGIKPGER